jgi:NAD(P)-dependent dehydrogenase (short-subunit alcohol dehydrogenase family)
LRQFVRETSVLTSPLGIGKSTAFALARNGISGLALLDLNLSLLETAQAELQIQHPNVGVEILQVDVADEASVDAAVQQTVERFGRIDIGVNCAGISGNPTSTHQMTLAEWKKVIDINQTGVWLCQRALIRQMLTQE